MATYKRFEDLPVWNEAIRLAEEVYLMTQSPDFKGHYSLRDQIERAAVSVSNNIAEGFERGTTNELLSFIYIARGSAGEVRSMCHLIERLRPFVHLKSKTSSLRTIAESCSRQLRAWADSLQNSDIEGPRRLNEKSKAAWERTQSRQEGEEWFRQKLIETLGPAHPSIPKPKKWV